MSKIESFLKASRFNVIPVMIIPVVLGSVGAFSWQQTFHWFLFVVTLVGASAMHLFSNMINDLWDYRNDVDSAAGQTEGAISTNSQFLTKGIWSERKFAAWTWGMLALALVCGVVLAISSGYMVIVYGFLGALIAYFYVAPPIRFGYRGKGYSEIAIVLAFGVLPVLGSYYAQTAQFDWRALMVSLPIGGLTTLILFNHHFLHWRADQAAGKRTLVVVFGEKKTLRFSVLLLVLSFVVLVLAIGTGALPWYSLAGILTVFPIIGVYRNLKEHNPSAAYLPLMAESLKVSIRCGAVMAVSLLIQGFLSLFY